MMDSRPEMSCATATDDPDTLFDLAMDCIINNLNILTEGSPDGPALRMKNNIILPSVICERFLEAYQVNRRVTDDLANVFRDHSRTHLTTLKLRNSCVSDKGLLGMLEHKPRVVELDCCELLTPVSIDYINAHSENLVSLKIGPLTDIITNENMNFFSDGFILKAPKLRQLTVRLPGLVQFQLRVLIPLTGLTHLDLSECKTLGHMSCVTALKHLQVLILHNVSWLQDFLGYIMNIASLRYLDISQSDTYYGKYFSGDGMLDMILTMLPNLEGLDISGTNLASSWTDTHDIPGLMSRTERPLHFFGLYNTQGDACRRRHIPALKIAGDADENQILNAMEANIERPVVLTSVLDDLCSIYRHDNKQQVMRALNLVLRAMNSHVRDKNVHINGSAILFYIMRSIKAIKNNMKTKRKIIQALLKGMEAHISDETMMKNGCLTLCQFSIPADVIFEYERVVTILMYGVSEMTQDQFVQHLSIHLLNSLAFKVNSPQKLFLGYIGVITTMLQVIWDHLERNLCDDILEVAWSTMWNVTNETPQNSQRFLESSGLDYFLACQRNFPLQEELLRNMIGLLGNVAKEQYLRHYLMKPVLVKVFYDLLHSSSDGFEVCFDAAAVLAYMASDGPSAWNVAVPARHLVLQRITEVVQRWDLKVERNITYCTFGPILKLLSVYHTPQCQHWAVWALANFTTVYPERYCSLVESEGGVQLLRTLASHPEPYDCIRRLATLVMHNCSAHQLSKQPSGGTSPPATPNN